MTQNEEVRQVFYHDFHVHTSYSPCALDKPQALPDQMVKAGEGLGLKTIGFTDHFAQFPPYPTTKWKNCSEKMIISLRHDIEKIITPIQILIGVEADVIQADKLSIDKEFAKSLDYVIISASHFHLPRIKKPRSIKPLPVAHHYIAMLKSALNYDFISIIAHPFKTPRNPFGSPLEYMDKIPINEFYEIAAMAKKQNVAMEINGVLSVDDEYLRAVKPFVRICQEIGVKFSYGSDAHNKKDLNLFQGIIKATKGLNLSLHDFITADELIKNHRKVSH